MKIIVPLFLTTFFAFLLFMPSEWKDYPPTFRKFLRAYAEWVMLTLFVLTAMAGLLGSWIWALS